MNEGVNDPLGDLCSMAEALADVLIERGLVISTDATSTARVLDASEVGFLLGRDRQWVYDHAAELGAFRFGDGPKARLGFDRVTVERWKRDRRLGRTTPTTPTRRRIVPKSAPQNGTNLIPYEARG